MICNFIAYLSLRNYAYSTINTYVSSVGFMHRVGGVVDPTNSFIVGLMLDGVRRDRGGSRDLRLPITYEHLRKIITVLPSICNSQFEALLFKAVFSCMFFGFLRIGEVAAESKVKVNDAVLKRSDIVFQEDKGNGAMVFNFRISKNNQFGEHHQSVVISSQTDKVVCPVLALRDYFRQASGDTVMLFTHFDLTPLTKYQLNHVLKSAVLFCDFPNPNLYQSHSFRIGAATSAKKRGVSDEEIQAMGRWRSGAFR